MSPLRRIRLARRKGLNEVAREAGIAASCLSRLERGLSRSPRHAEIMARYWDHAISETEILYPERIQGAASRRRTKTLKASSAA